MEQTNQSSVSPPGSTDDHLHAITSEAGALLNEAKSQGTEQYEHYRDTAADQLESLVEGARSAASTLEGKDSLGLSQYLGQVAEYMGNFAEQIRHESAEDLLQRGSRLARDNPAVFLAGSVVLGFALSRFLGASASHTTSSSSNPANDTSEPNVNSAPIPDRASDVSNQQLYTPVDPVGMGAATPVSGSPSPGAPFKGGE